MNMVKQQGDNGRKTNEGRNRGEIQEDRDKDHKEDKTQTKETQAP